MGVHSLLRSGSGSKSIHLRSTCGDSSNPFGRQAWLPARRAGLSKIRAESAVVLGIGAFVLLTVKPRVNGSLEEAGRKAHRASGGGSGRDHDAAAVALRDPEIPQHVCGFGLLPPSGFLPTLPLPVTSSQATPLCFLMDPSLSLSSM